MVKKHDRLLEILPGFISWNIILFPYWGILVIPNIVAYFILIFNIYWFYQSFQLSLAAIISHFRIEATKKYNWLADIAIFPDSKKVVHLVIIPTYKEPIYILKRTLDSLKNQELSTKQIIPLIAFEEKENIIDRNEKEKIIKKEYSNIFKEIITTVHNLVPGEVAGKAANERFAAVYFKKNRIDNKKIDRNYLVVTSSDSDHTFHKKHFAVLTFKFLDSPQRYNRFWQAAVMFYNNIWEVPALTRVPNTFGSIWNLAQLTRKDRLINGQNYSLSYNLLEDADFWDPDKIPEDWGIFFKAFYKRKGKVEVEPIFLPLFADAPKSKTFFGTLKNQYEQFKRWAWGVSDVPWIMKKYFQEGDVAFGDKFFRLFFVLKAHILWPVNWFLITIGLTLPTVINPAFGRTSLGYMVPQISSAILTIALVFLVIMIIIDSFYKPKRPAGMPAWRTMISPLEFILMPLVGFLFSALPGLDAHTRLMLGKYIEYKVTEKV